MLTSKQIRNGFIDFFRQYGHEFVPSSPIVPAGDDTLLFANAGMNQFKDIFLGLSSSRSRRVVNSQKCLRVSGKHNDLEQVGKDTYHHTFFEMLGNWSFDDYFKAEAISWAWQLLTEVWGIEPNRLWATVFAGDAEDNCPADDEAGRLWQKLTSISKERVLFCGRKDNFWEMGETGPCGPCSEIHIDLGPGACDMKDSPGHKCSVNSDCSRFIELWNLVFIQYNRERSGKLVNLGAKYVDTGAGLERIVAVLQNKTSNYDTDLFTPIISAISDLCSRKYTSQLNNETDNAFRVISDHIRSLTFAMTDGAIPSNEGRGYVIRRLLRRAARFGRKLQMHEPFIYKLVPVVVDCLGDAFGEIRERADYVSMVVKAEEESFGRTLDRGIEIFNDAAERAAKEPARVISGEDAFQLYDTYGFPLDLTQLMAEERNLKVDTDRFEELMSQQRQRARQAQKSAVLSFVPGDVELPATDDSAKYKTDTCTTKVVGWIDSDGFHTEGSFGIERIDKDETIGVVLEQTCFYAEAGGQVGDCGMIKSSGGCFAVERAEKLGDCVSHWGKFTEGGFSVGQKVKVVVSKDRDATKKNHTATHLLQWALQQTLGKSVAQQGSLVCPEYLRFDFTYPQALTDEQVRKVENLVEEKIAQDLPVTSEVMPKSQADKLGAMALFGQKYGSEVRVVAVSAGRDDELDEAFSKEFCGGTHVDKIGLIGGFKIIKEESISAGIRRITALTGQALARYLRHRSDIVDELSKMLKVPAEELVERVSNLIKDNKKLSKQLKSAAHQAGSETMNEAKQLLKEAEKIGKTSIIISRISPTSPEQARVAIDMLKKKAKSAAVVFGFANEDKVTLLAAVTEDLVKKGLKAGDIVKKIAPLIEGGGGGRAQMAQAGGKNPKRIDDALAKAAEIIKEKLAG